MAKRQANDATNSFDKKFEIDTDTEEGERNIQHGTDTHT